MPLQPPSSNIPEPPLTHLPDLLSDALPLSHPSLWFPKSQIHKPRKRLPEFQGDCIIRNMTEQLRRHPGSILDRPTPFLPSSPAVRAVFPSNLPSWMLQPNRFKHDLEWKMYGILAGPSPRCLLLLKQHSCHSQSLLQRVVSSLVVYGLPNLTQIRHCDLLKVLHAKYQTVDRLAKNSDGCWGRRQQMPAGWRMKQWPGVVLQGPSL